MTQFERAQLFVKDIIALCGEGDELAMLLALSWVSGQMEARLRPDDLVALQKFKTLAAESSGPRAM